VHLLVVEDDPRLGRTLSRLLTDDRHVVDLAADGVSALELLEATHGFEAMILDLGLPDIDGIEVARRVRAAGSAIPILILTARDGLDERVRGLDAGADDYITKPFSYEELAARLRALRRRAGAFPSGPGTLVRVGPIVLDEARREVSVSGSRVDLSGREFALLECLLRHPGQALSREQLLDLAWPFGVAVTPNTIDAFVTLLRRKLGPAGAARIETIRGVGYRMSDG
jgi:two-component system, OmpR family, response regulator